MAIEAAHYGEARKRLMADPIVRDMAIGLQGVPTENIAHSDGGPRFEFMGAANDEYRRRGGTDAAHMGAVAEALLIILKAYRGY